MGCGANVQTMAILVDGGKCAKLAGGDPFTDANFEVGNSDDNEGLDIIYSQGDQGYQLKVNIGCDSTGLFQSSTLNASDNSNIIANFGSSTGCKNGQLSAIWDWFKNNKWPMFVVFLVGGIVICFLGRTLFKPVLFITGIIMASSLIMLLFYSTFLKSNT